jgi:hypothetical protein
VLLYFTLPDSPSTASFLTPQERVIADLRPQRIQHSFKTNEWSKSQCIEALKDPKTWLISLIIAIASITNGVVSNVSRKFHLVKLLQMKYTANTIETVWVFDYQLIWLWRTRYYFITNAIWGVPGGFCPHRYVYCLSSSEIALDNRDRWVYSCTFGDLVSERASNK